MENRAKVLVAGTRTAGPLHSETHGPEHWHRARAAHVCLLLMGMPRVNVLLVGIDNMVWNVLETLPLNFREPISTWSPGEPLTLPSGKTGTMILHAIGNMTHDEQLRLFDWLGRAGRRTQVISTTPESLLSRVQDGTFIDLLYYRLNTVCVNVTA
jgi:Sigma-54 interaction domain